MSTFIPLTRQELIESGTKRTELEQNYQRVSSGLYLPKNVIPDQGTRALPLVTRALIAQHRYPTAVIGGWSALAIQSLPYFQDDAPVIVHGRSNAPPADEQLNIRFRHRPVDLFSEFTIDQLHLRTAPVSLALVDCLQSIAKGTHSWWVPPVQDSSFKEVRSVQVIDSVRRFFGITLAEVREHAKGRFDKHRLEALWTLSDAGADSPPETSLRLMVRDLAGWKSQYPFWDEFGMKISVTDLADEESKTALFYDGEHHLHRKQRDFDSWANQQLQRQGWTPVRITAGQLRYPDTLRTDLQEIMRKSSRGSAKIA